MTSPVAERARKHRAALRAAGMRPLQIWVPDTRRKSFVTACRKQAAIVAQADRRDRELLDLLDRAAAEIDSWKA
jgi:hypothetical protein